MTESGSGTRCSALRPKEDEERTGGDEPFWEESERALLDTAQSELAFSLCAFSLCEEMRHVGGFDDYMT